MEAVGLLAAEEFGAFPGDDVVDGGLGDVEGVDDVVVEDCGVVGGDGAQGKFFVSWDAELADDEEVERCVECLGDLEGDGDAAAREAEDEEVGQMGAVGEMGGELSAGVGSVMKGQGHERLLHHHRQREFDVTCGMKNKRFKGRGKG